MRFAARHCGHRSSSAGTASGSRRALRTREVVDTLGTLYYAVLVRRHTRELDTARRPTVKPLRPPSAAAQPDDTDLRTASSSMMLAQQRLAAITYRVARRDAFAVPPCAATNKLATGGMTRCVLDSRAPTKQATQ